MTTRTQLPVFGFLCAVSILFWWQPLIATLGLAVANEAYTHILLILPVSLALILSQRTALRTIPERSIALGSTVLLVAAFLAAVVRWGHTGTAQDVRLSLSMLALVTWWIGSVILCFGLQVFRSFLFPLCFLFWIVPIPSFLLNGIVKFLQYKSAFAARVLFFIGGVPVSRDGIILSIPGLDLEVARECSSIRSSMMLVVVTMVLAQLFLHSPWRKALLILLSVPLAVAKNGLRIFTIGELATRVDPSYLDGRLHRQGGVVFFVISLVALVFLLLIVRRNDSSGALMNSVPAESRQ